MDFQDGLLLGALVSVWEKIQLDLPHPDPPVNHSQSLENVANIFTALSSKGFPLQDSDSKTPQIPLTHLYVLYYHAFCNYYLFWQKPMK